MPSARAGCSLCLSSLSVETMSSCTSSPLGVPGSLASLDSTHSGMLGRLWAAQGPGPVLLKYQGSHRCSDAAAGG